MGPGEVVTDPEPNAKVTATEVRMQRGTSPLPVGTEVWPACAKGLSERRTRVTQLLSPHTPEGSSPAPPSPR